MTSANVVEARQVVRRFGARMALDGLSLEIPAGGVFGVAGPNGSGKSTFLAMVAAAEMPESGTLTVLGQPPTRATRRRLGVVFQENASDPAMAPAELLALVARMYGLSRPDARSRAAVLLAAVGLGDRAHAPISTLSGGMRRRLELARALLHSPDLLLLDEPTTGVDPHERQAFWECVRTQVGPSGTVVVATNDLAEADEVCHRVAFLRQGRVVAAGSPAELKTGLRRESVCLTLSADNAMAASRITAVPGASDVAADGDQVRLLTDDAATLVPALFGVLGPAIRAVTIRPATLADAYFALVGRRTREFTN